MIRLALCLMIMTSTALSAPREYSFDLWDWTTPCRDLKTFKLWAADLKSIGVTRLEISAPWNLLEPRPGEFDLSFVTDRLNIAKSHDLGMRIRINSFWNGATPTWFDGDRWCDIDGKPPTGAPTPVSITDERFWRHYAPLCAKIAEACRGEDVYLNPFIGIHAELKWSDWWSYDASTLALWRKTIRQQPRAGWLSDLVGDAELPDVPPVPKATSGIPDTSADPIAWIGFREWAWRDAVRRFNEAVRASDADAKTSAPLGESFRRQSAQMSNLDYFGLSRGMNQIVHSYDFFWHVKDEPWHAAAAVASFRGISGIETIVFEFDGASTLNTLGYDEAKQIAIARAALSQGAGLKVANFSYETRLPSTFGVFVEFGKLVHDVGEFAPAPPAQTVLLFVSKWANYSFREESEWLHEAQFGAWRMLNERGLPVRIICEDNLAEDLSGYRALYVVYAPLKSIPAKPRTAFRELSQRLPSIIGDSPDTRPAFEWKLP